MIWKVFHLLAGKLAQYWCYVTGITGEMSLDTFFNCCWNTPWNGRQHSLQRNYQCIKPNIKRTLARYSDKCFKCKHYILKHDPFSSRPKIRPYSTGMKCCRQNWFRIMWDQISRGSSCATSNEIDKLRWMLMCPAKYERLWVSQEYSQPKQLNRGPKQQKKGDTTPLELNQMH